MRRQIILDTGPLVAFIDRRDDFHEWSDRTFKTVQQPLTTCEPVITEACFPLSKIRAAQEAVMSLISDGSIQIDFSLNDNTEALSSLITRYNSVPMSLADACLVRMAELNRNGVVMTIDSDFKIYRMHRNQVIPSIMPDDQRNH
ncbi:MAG: type II toxin-antitoxin system VapC family toxin [Phormidesmis sp.]|jgi:predicted nucleic acid-binding protein